MLVGLALALLARLGGAAGRSRRAGGARRHRLGVATYYARRASSSSVVEAHDVARGATFDDGGARSSSPGRRSSSCRPRSLCWPASPLRRQRLADDREAAAGGRAGGHRRRRTSSPGGSRGASAAQPRGARSLRAPDGPARLSGHRLALRGLPVHRLVLLLCGPCSHVGRAPDRLLAVRARPLDTLGWKVELVVDPADRPPLDRLLYRAHRRRRRLLEGAPPECPAAPAQARYRTRVSVAAGSILLLLVSLPFVPAVAGVGAELVRYTLQPRFTPDMSGSSSRHRSGAGQALLVAGPSERRIRPTRSGSTPADVRSLVVRAAAVDVPARTASSTSTDSYAVPLASARRPAVARSRRPCRLRPGATCSSPRTRACSAAATSRT